MSGVHDFALFVAAGLLLNFTPGADTLYIVARSTAQGFRAGAMAALGIGAGCLVHIAAATFGLSALLAASATAFTLVKLAGAVYLVYLGITLWPSSRRTAVKATHPPPASLRKVFAQGVVTNVLNPKVALFFLSFLPQFIKPDLGRPGVQALVLGLVFVALGACTDSTYALLASGLRDVLLRSRVLPFVRRWVAGTVFIGLGVVAATASAAGTKKR